MKGNSRCQTYSKEYKFKIKASSVIQIMNKHHKLLTTLIHLQQESSRRLKSMKNVQANVIPVYTILGLSGLAALLKAFGLL